MIGLLATLILFPLIGAAVSRRSWSEAYLLGVGSCGSALFVAGVLHVPLVVTLGVLVAVAIGVLLRRRTEIRDMALRMKPSRPHGATVVMIIPLVVLFIATIIIPLSDFDGRAFWVLKAKGIAHDGVVDGAFFRGQGAYDPRNDYPLLLPIDGAVIFGISRDFDDRQIRWIYFFLLVALALHIRERIASLVSPEMGAWCAALLVWIPQFTVQLQGGALSAYSDIAMGAFAAGAFFELIGNQERARRRREFLFGLWLVFLVLTKSEGLPFALVLLAIGAFVLRKRIVVPAALTFIATSALIVWRHRILPSEQEDIVALLPTIPQKLDRVIPALRAFARHLFVMPQWGLFWIAVLIAVIVSLRPDRRKDFATRAAIVIMASMFVIYTMVYIATSWIMIDLIESSADRLLMHLIGPAMFLLAAASLPIAVRGAEGRNVQC